jgi:membrane-associated protein
VDLVGLTGLTLYVVLFVVIFAESGILVGFWLPGDTILFAAGLLAADPNTGVSVVVVAVGVTAAATAGAFVGYLTGARMGRSYLERRYGTLLARAEVFYERFGTMTLIAARFVPWLRTFAPVLAGAVAMPKRAFARAVAVGAVVWGTGLVLLGYAAADIPGLEDHAVWVAVAIVAGAVVSGLAAEWLRRRAASRAASPGPSIGSTESTSTGGPISSSPMRSDATRLGTVTVRTQEQSDVAASD